MPKKGRPRTHKEPARLTKHITHVLSCDEAETGLEGQEMQAGVGLGLIHRGLHSRPVSSSLPAVLGVPVQVFRVTVLFHGNFQPPRIPDQGHSPTALC